MRKIGILLSLMAIFLLACNNQQTKTDDQQAENQTSLTPDVPVEVTVGSFDQKAGELVGKLVTIRGTADHICKHDGKKLFLISTEEEGRVKVTTGEDMAAFNTENEGDDFIVTGIVDDMVVDEAYLQEWEEELQAGIDEKKHLGGGEEMTPEEKEAGEHEDAAAAEQIANYRQMMADQGTDKLHFYSIVCTEYEIVEE